MDIEKNITQNTPPPSPESLKTNPKSPLGRVRSMESTSLETEFKRPKLSATKSSFSLGR